MKKAIQFILYLVGILYFPTIVILSLTADQSGSFFEFSTFFLTLILLFLSFHFFCAFIEIGFSVLRLFEKKARTRAERILNIATISLAAFMLVITLVDPEREFNVLAIILSQVLIVLWIIGDIIFKQRKFYPEVFKKGAFWITAVSLFIVSAILLAVTGGKFEKSEPDPLDPIAFETQIEETHTKTD